MGTVRDKVIGGSGPMAGEGAALHLGPGGLQAASIAARLPKVYIAMRAASIANAIFDITIGCWMW